MLLKNCIDIISKEFKNEKSKNKEKQSVFSMCFKHFFPPCLRHLFKTVHSCFERY